MKRVGESAEDGRNHSNGHKYDEGRNGSGGNGEDPEGRFMGVGKDGVWISRQNFVKS